MRLYDSTARNNRTRKVVTGLKSIHITEHYPCHIYGQFLKKEDALKCNAQIYVNI